jgi:enhancer of polycomb-like protein
VLIDDYDPKYLRYSMSLLTEADHIALTVDPILHLVPTSDGRQTVVLPYRLGMQQTVKRDAQGNLWYHTLQPMLPPNHALALKANMAGAVAAGTPVAMQHQIKKMPPPSAVLPMISSNGGMRPSLTPIVVSSSQQQQPQQSAPTPLTPNQVPLGQPVNGVSPVTRTAIAMPHGVKLAEAPEPISNGLPTQPLIESSQAQEVAMKGIAPPCPMSQNQAPPVVQIVE